MKVILCRALPPNACREGGAGDEGIIVCRCLVLARSNAVLRVQFVEKENFRKSGM